MAFEDVARHQESLNQEIARLVLTAVRKHGVPVSVDQASDLVDVLYPRVVKARSAAYRAQLVELARQARTAGIEIAPEPLEEYPRKALFDAIADVSRMTPNSSKIHVDVLDTETGKLVLTPVLPDQRNRRDVEVVQRVGRELAARVARHVHQAGRRVISESAHNGSARFAGSGESAEVGYARVLSGRENCAFCTMLASRGAVYKKDTVVRRRDGRRYHDGCDCIPVLVVNGKPWFGQKQAEELYARWQETTWPNGRPSSNQWEAWRRRVEAGNLDVREYSPFTHRVKKTGSLVLNGVKPHAHEMVTYRTLVNLGMSVELKPVSGRSGVKTADAVIDGVECEIKAPEGNGRNTVRDLLREGSKQAGNLIVDLHRTEMTTEDALRQIEQAMSRYNRIEEVLLITHDRQLIRRGNGQRD